MESQNIKVYLGISFALIILFVLILVIPFSKKTTNNDLPSTTSVPFPTSVETDSTGSTDVTDSTNLTNIPADFTGVAEEELPPQVLDTALQKKDLRQKSPLDLSGFIIDFDYGEDKFIITLKDPKDQAQREFESWRVNNYPGLSSEQFLLK